MAFLGFLPASGSSLSCLPVLACVGVLAVLLAALDGPAYEVRGNADVPYPAGPVKEVRVLDSLTVYVDGEPKPGQTVVGGIALIVLATAAFMTAAALHIATRRGRLIAFYLRDQARGWDTQASTSSSQSTRPSGTTSGSSPTCRGVAARRPRGRLLCDPRGRDSPISSGTSSSAPQKRPWHSGAGLGFFALAAAGDLAGKTTAEAYMELCSGLCIALGLTLLMYTHLRRNLRPDLEVPDEVTVVDQRARSRPPVGAAH